MAATQAGARSACDVGRSYKSLGRTVTPLELAAASAEAGNGIEGERNDRTWEKREGTGGVPFRGHGGEYNAAMGVCNGET